MVKKNTEMEVQKTRTSYLIREINYLENGDSSQSRILSPANYFFLIRELTNWRQFVLYNNKEPERSNGDLL